MKDILFDPEQQTLAEILRVNRSRYLAVNDREPRRILVHNARFIFTVDASQNVVVKRNTSIMIEDGMITDVFLAKSRPLDLSNVDMVYNAGSRGGIIVTPGFVNTHAHPPMYLLRSSLFFEEGEDLEDALRDMASLEQKMDAQAFLFSALGDFTEEQKSGITTTLSHYAVFEPVEEAATLCRHNVVNAVSAASNSHPKNSPALVEKFLKKKGTFTTPAIAIHYLYKAAPRDLRAIARMQKRYGALFTCHFAETNVPADECVKKFGMREIEVLEKFGLLNERTVISHVVRVTPEEIRRLVKARVGIAHLPTSNLIHKSGKFDLPVFVQAGGLRRVSLGTDSVISKNRLDLLTEAFETRVVHNERHTVSYNDLFAMMTDNGARVLGLENVGRIAKGYRADIAFWKLKDRGFLPYDEGNPMTLIGNMITHGGRNIRDLMIGGRFVISNRLHNLVNESKLIMKLQDEHMRMRKKLNK